MTVITSDPISAEYDALTTEELLKTAYCGNDNMFGGEIFYAVQALKRRGVAIDKEKVPEWLQ